MKNENLTNWRSLREYIAGACSRTTPFAAAALLLCAFPARANVLSWSGGSAASGNWNDSANWGYAGTPHNGDSLIFGGVVPARWFSTNNLSGLVLNQITYIGNYTNVNLYGSAFTITNSIVCGSSYGVNLINNSITLATADVTLSVSNNATLQFNGQLSGAVGVIKIGPGTLLYNYPSGNNSYAGTTYVNAGLLALNVGGSAAFEGPLVVGDGSGTLAIVRDWQYSEIGDSLPITLNDGGILDLNSYPETLSSNITFNQGGTIESGAALLTLSPNATITYNSGLFANSASLTGNVNLSSGDCTFNTGSGLFGGALYVGANVGGTATIHKTGGGALYLYGANTFSGLVSVEDGVLEAGSSAALGAATAGTVVTNGADLYVYGNVDIAAEPLTLASTDTAGSLVNLSGVNIWGGPITLLTNACFYVSTNTSLAISNAITGNYGVTELGWGTLSYVGTSNNSYVGTTYVNAGTLILSNALADYAAVPGPLVINTNCGVQELVPYGIDYNQPVTIYDGGMLNMNNALDYIGTLTLQSAIATTGPSGTLFLMGDVVVLGGGVSGASLLNGNVALWSVPFTTITNTVYFSYPDLRVSANLWGPAGTGLIKTGPGSVELNGNDSFSGGINIDNGYLQVDSMAAFGNANSNVVVSSGGSLVLQSNVIVTNKPLLLNGQGFLGLGAVYATGNESWGGPVTLQSDSTVTVYNAGDILTFSNNVSGPGGLAKEGAGALWYCGPHDNTYTGTTLVQQGLLALNVGGFHAYFGPMIIGDGDPSAQAKVQLEQSLEINTGTSMRIDNALLDLNNFSDNLPQDLDLTNAIVDSGAGLASLSSSAVVTNRGSSEFLGHLQLGSGDNTFFAYDSLNFFATVSGSGNFVEAGPGAIGLYANNTYSGLTTVANGLLEVLAPGALGTTNGGTIISNGASMILFGSFTITNEPLTLNGPGYAGSFGELEVQSDFQTNYWTGPVTVAGNSTIELLQTNSVLHFSGPISGSGGLELFTLYPNRGKLYFDGTSINTFTGNMFVDAGTTLLLNKSIAWGASQGNWIIGGTVRQLDGFQLAPATFLQINDGGLFDLNSWGAEVGLVNSTSNGALNLGSAVLTEGYASIAGQNALINGQITGNGELLKTGGSVLTLAGNTSNYFQSIVNGGTLMVEAQQPGNQIGVITGATFGGTGTVGNVLCYGNLAPAGALGTTYAGATLTVSNLTLAPGATLEMNVHGPTPDGYDQLVIQGTNALANAALAVNMNPLKTMHVGDSVMLISNAAAGNLRGTFASVAQGAAVPLNGYNFIASYAGGSGNDFTLTDDAVPAAAPYVSINGGNGNYAIDPNECDLLSLTITNLGPTAMNNVSAVLSSTTPFVIVNQPYSQYPDLAVSGTGINFTPFSIATLPQFPCGSIITLQLTLTFTGGSFTIPVLLQSIEGPSTPFRFDQNTTLSIPDVGTADSALTVSGFTNFLDKVTVSLWITHPLDSDLTNISLVAPDGTTVLLSAANGGSSANYGTGSSDASRTLFDAAATTSITNGVAPFVGTFTPQNSLGSFFGRPANGTWHLTISDGYGGSLGTLRAWSLFLSPPACVDGGGYCASCLMAITNALIGTEPVEAGRILANGIPAAYGAPKSWPGSTAGSYHYKAFTYTNTTAADAAVTVTLTAACDVQAVAYLGLFSAANISSNYLGDAGTSTAGGTTSFSCDVPSGALFQIVVNETSPGAGCSRYIVQVDGLPCPPPTLTITPAANNSVQLTWPTWAGGYQLIDLWSLSSPSWGFVPNLPVVRGGWFSVTNACASTNLFYRLRQP